MIMFRNRSKTRSDSAAQENPQNDTNCIPNASSGARYVPEWRMIYGFHLPQTADGASLENRNPSSTDPDKTNT